LNKVLSGQSGLSSAVIGQSSSVSQSERRVGSAVCWGVFRKIYRGYLLHLHGKLRRFKHLKEIK